MCEYIQYIYITKKKSNNIQIKATFFNVHPLQTETKTKQKQKITMKTKQKQKQKPNKKQKMKKM